MSPNEAFKNRQKVIEWKEFFKYHAAKLKRKVEQTIMNKIWKLSSYGAISLKK